LFCWKEGGAVVLLLRRSRSCEVAEGKDQGGENQGLFDSSIKNFQKFTYHPSLSLSELPDPVRHHIRS